MTDQQAEELMRRALALATRGWGTTHPNPMVGALIVEDGEIVAEGWHERAGEAHAEKRALQNLGRKPKPGATMVVTLEPCSTAGRTGACTQAIIEAGISTVIVGAVDPNPDHAGDGFQVLRKAGVEVISGVLAEDCDDLNLIFNHHIVTGQPLITGKVATTLDGKVATRTGDSKWITGPAARADVMRWRRLYPAIAVGAGTVLADNPSLTARPPLPEAADVVACGNGLAAGPDSEVECCPQRFVFDSRLRTVPKATTPSENWPKLYADEWHERTTVVTREDAKSDALARLKDAGLGIWQLPPSCDGQSVCLQSWRDRCASEGLTGVLVEGGSGLLSGMFDADVLNYLIAYRAPKLLGDDEALPFFRSANPTEHMANALQLRRIRQATIGTDQLMRGWVSR